MYVCTFHLYFSSPFSFIFFFSASETGLEVMQSHQKMLLPVVFLTRNRSRSVWNHPRKPQLSRELFSNFAGTEHWISDQGVKMADVGGFGGREGRHLRLSSHFSCPSPSLHIFSPYEIRAAAHLPQVTQPNTGTNVNKQSRPASPRSSSRLCGYPPWHDLNTAADHHTLKKKKKLPTTNRQQADPACQPCFVCDFSSVCIFSHPPRWKYSN